MTQALDDLRALALVWGEDDVLRLVASVPDAVGPYPAGLGRPAARLVPVRSVAPGKRIGVAKERFVAPDDIDRDNAVIAKMFEGDD